MRRLVIILILQSNSLSVQRIVHERVKLVVRGYVCRVNTHRHIVLGLQNKLLAPVAEDVRLKQRSGFCAVYGYCIIIAEDYLIRAGVVITYFRTEIAACRAVAVKQLVVKVAVPENSEISRGGNVCHGFKAIGIAGSDRTAVRSRVIVIVSSFTVPLLNAGAAPELEIASGSCICHHTPACITGIIRMIQLLAVGGVYERHAVVGIYGFAEIIGICASRLLLNVHIFKRVVCRVVFCEMVSVTVSSVGTPQR